MKQAAEPHGSSCMASSIRGAKFDFSGILLFEKWLSPAMAEGRDGEEGV